MLMYNIINPYDIVLLKKECARGKSGTGTENRLFLHFVNFFRSVMGPLFLGGTRTADSFPVRFLHHFLIQRPQMNGGRIHRQLLNFLNGYCVNKCVQCLYC